MTTQPTVIEEILEQLGLLSGDWQDLDVIDASCGFVVSNIDSLAKLPKSVRGDLSLLTSDVALFRRKTLMGLCRRLARELQGAIIRRRKQIRQKNGKTVSRYSYKLIVGK